MIERVLEPEVMDDPEESQAYDDMDHAEVNRVFVQDLLATGKLGERVLDLGTGTARIPIELCEQHDECNVIASDAAVSMLEIAKLNIAIAGFEHRIELQLVDSKQLQLDDEEVDTVISNSLIHHVPEPMTVVREIARVLRPGGKVFLRDLMRPESLEEVEDLVRTYAGEEIEESQQLFRQSLIAALTVEEMQELVEQVGFSRDSVQATSDRHWTWAAEKRQS